MKKTLITLLALAGLAMGNEDQTVWTFSNGSAGGGNNYVTTAAIQFTLTDTATGYVTGSNKGLEASFPEILELETITITKCGQSVASGVWGVLTDTSTGVVLGAVHSGATSANQAVTFNFADSPITINSGAAYTLTFIKETVTTDLASGYGVSIGSRFLTDTVFLDSKNKFIVYTVSDATTYSKDANLSYSDAKINGAFGTYTPAISITATAVPNSSIPEPATATLSLLALAGLAARRRRH